jgi:hypothetical protein
MACMTPLAPTQMTPAIRQDAHDGPGLNADGPMLMGI